MQKKVACSCNECGRFLILEDDGTLTLEDTIMEFTEKVETWDGAFVNGKHSVGANLDRLLNKAFKRVA